MIQIFLTDGRILVEMKKDLTDFLVKAGQDWVVVNTPSVPEVVSTSQIVSFKEVFFNE